MDIHEEFMKRKESAIAKDLDSAFSGYERLVRQVNLIRAWTVTLMVASVGFLFSGIAISSIAVSLPAFSALIGFFILELRERSSMSFNKDEVLNIQRIFMIENKEDYQSEIKNYEFRDLRLNRLERSEKVRHLVKSAKDAQVLFWYVFWNLVIVSAISITKA